MQAARRGILITRPLDEAGVTARRLEALGYRPIIAPMLRISRRTPILPPNIQAVLVTSGNAIPALPPSPTPVLAVGDATAARATAHGFSRVTSAARDAEALAALAARMLDPASGPLLLASGARQGHKLAADLRAHGFRVIRRVCYAAVPVRRFPSEASAALRAGEVHAVLFLSAETATVFARLLPLACRPLIAPVAALAIGAAAAAALEPLPWLRLCRAENPTLDDVLALI